jgi:hypothetical protein
MLARHHSRRPFAARPPLRRGALAVVAGIIGVVAGSAGCAGPSAARADSATVAVTSRAGAIELDNRTGRRVYYRVIERETSARVRWAPCVDLPECEGFGPNATVRIPYDGVTGYAPGARDAVVFWWYAAPTPTGELAADSVRSVVVGF